MHDPMTHGDELVVPAPALKEIDQVGDRPAVPELGALVPGLRTDVRALRILGRESRLRVEAFDLPFQHQWKLVAAGVERAELEAGRTGVEHEDRVGHGVTPRPWRSRGGPWRPSPPRRRRRAGARPKRPGGAGRTAPRRTARGPQ